MRAFTFLFVLFSLAVFTINVNAQCIDSTLIDSTVSCPAVFEPVCDCDGNQYANNCIALNEHGVTSWHTGACPVDSNCKADFSVDLQPSLVGYNATFSNLSGLTGVGYLWTFGDGNTSNLENPTHLYTLPGNYVVCLAVNDTTNSCTSTFCRVVQSGSYTCVDSSKIDSLAICPAVVDPVCGCNNVTYQNSCLADAAGVQRWTEGVCTGTGVGEVKGQSIMLTAYPNPFSNQVNITVQQTSNQPVTLWVTDLAGKQITFITQNNHQQNHFVWNAAGMPSGCYLLHYQSGTQSGVEKLLLVR